MAVNLRLTHAVKDREVQKFQVNGPELLIRFVDGLMMTVTIAECNSLPLHEDVRIRQVSEDQTMLLFQCEDESILDVTIVDPGNSVIISDKRSEKLFTCYAQAVNLPRKRIGPESFRNLILACRQICWPQNVHSPGRWD
jgi:hypothetical protein